MAAPELEFNAWWGRVTNRLSVNGIEELPQCKPVDHAAFEAGMESDEWAWTYFTAGEEDEDHPESN